MEEPGVKAHLAEQRGDVPMVCFLKPSEQTIFKNANIEKLSYKSGRIKC